jgi:hypothetical protein
MSIAPLGQVDQTIGGQLNRDWTKHGGTAGYAAFFFTAIS